MPEISRFLGIVIRMFHRGEHGPPHFHATYAGKTIRIEIETLTPMDPMCLSPRVLGLIVEWASRHRNELMENWGLATKKKPLKKIEPLD